MRLEEVRSLLEAEVLKRNCFGELCEERPDPLMVARTFPDELFALTCAVFAYGNARNIVGLLSSFDPHVIEYEDEATIRRTLEGKYYRFQTGEDIIQWHITLRRLREEGGARAAFMQGYLEGGTVEGLSTLIRTLYALNPYRSHGYDFLIGKPVGSVSKAPAMKRWMMYLRWMVRQDELDMGLWDGIQRSDLIMPLDTHTFAVSKQLGLLNRRTCDLKAAIELTDTLRRFDPDDPVRYDFALYRIGQEKLL